MESIVSNERALPGEPQRSPGRVSGCPDSNRGPRRPERRALPGCATPRGGNRVPRNARSETRSSPSATSSWTSRRIRTTGRSVSRSSGARRGAEDRLRRLGLARALRASRGARRAARPRPPRPLLAERLAGRRRRSSASACGRSSTHDLTLAALPPRARRPPRDRQQRLSSAASSGSSRSDASPTSAGAGRSPSPSPASEFAERVQARRRPHAARLLVRARGDPPRRRAARAARPAQLAEARRGGLRLLRHGRGGRADEALGQGGGHPLRRGRPLRDRDVGRAAPLPSGSPTSFGVEWEFVDLPNPV